MKKKRLSMQYNDSAKNYVQLHVGENKNSTKQFFKIVRKYAPGQRALLDIGCGSGSDSRFYRRNNFSYFGLDASNEMVKLARKNQKLRIAKGSFTSSTVHFWKGPNQPYLFDMVVSKWAMQTTLKINKVYEYVSRVLDSGGIFVFLTVHPFRQFLEKKKTGKNYFKQEVVASEIFNKQITVYEPTHTVQEYLSPYFLKHFELLEIKEDYEFPAAEQIGGDIYPTHLIVVARK